MLTRKKFVGKSLLYAGALFAASSIFPAMKSIRLLMAEDNIDGSNFNLSESKIQMLSYASLAPSGHNAQPWRVKIVSESEWIIGWDKTRALPAVDPFNRELLLSIGAFCEALSIAAKSMGLDITKNILAADGFSSDLVKINFKISKTSDQFMDVLKRRMTIRNNFLSVPIKSEDIKFISSGVDSKLFTFDKGSREAGVIESAVLESNKVQVWRDDAQKELSSWIRWKDKDALKYKNGLTPASMGINGIAGWYVKNFYDSENVMSNAFREQTIKVVEKSLSSYGSWIIVTSKKNNPETLIGAGGDFLRLGLNSVNKKIALHPMTQPLEEKGFTEKLQSALGIKDKIQFILRAGYVEDYPKPVTQRMAVESILDN